MDVIYAAERPSIAKLLGDYVDQDVSPEDIEVAENPAETGSFLIGWRFRCYVLSPAGRVHDLHAAMRQRTDLRYRLPPRRAVGRRRAQSGT
jgi:hypothetical protein